MPKKEKISGAVRGRKDKRLQILAVRGGNLCGKQWEMFSDKVQQGVHTDDESFLWMASCRACLNALTYDRVLFLIVLR